MRNDPAIERLRQAAMNQESMEFHWDELDHALNVIEDMSHILPGKPVLLAHYFAEGQVWSGKANIRCAKHLLGYPEWIYDILLIDSNHYLFDVPGNMLTELAE